MRIARLRASADIQKIVLSCIKIISYEKVSSHLFIWIWNQQEQSKMQFLTMIIQIVAITSWIKPK